MKRFFAVVVSVGFATQLIQMDSVHKGQLPTGADFVHVIYLILALFLIIQSWDEYFISIEEKQLTPARFYSILQSWLPIRRVLNHSRQGVEADGECIPQRPGASLRVKRTPAKAPINFVERCDSIIEHEREERKQVEASGSFVNAEHGRERATARPKRSGPANSLGSGKLTGSFAESSPPTEISVSVSMKVQ
jgi:hypothetical protein